ncbi:hypothetical protein GLOIN_2v1485046 [Rhizophagus irregularis DAOM 181602=DAOM 197198]|nr:hypothetical protein GLOIN_2v1485046 [Rhizophagus irregularis DAOM 181602=DAOM 197198]
MNITIIQIINETFEKLKCRLDENEFRIIFNYHAKLLQILNERSMMILTEEFFTKRSRNMLDDIFGMKDVKKLLNGKKGRNNEDN